MVQLKCPFNVVSKLFAFKASCNQELAYYHIFCFQLCRLKVSNIEWQCGYSTIGYLWKILIWKVIWICIITSIITVLWSLVYFAYWFFPFCYFWNTLHLGIKYRGVSIFLFSLIHLWVRISLYTFMIFLSGDVKANPGPRTKANNAFWVCHWNLNSISAHNYSKVSLLKA